MMKDDLGMKFIAGGGLTEGAPTSYTRLAIEIAKNRKPVR